MKFDSNDYEKRRNKVNKQIKGEVIDGETNEYGKQVIIMEAWDIIYRPSHFLLLQLDTADLFCK